MVNIQEGFSAARHYVDNLVHSEEVARLRLNAALAWSELSQYLPRINNRKAIPPAVAVATFGLITALTSLQAQGQGNQPERGPTYVEPGQLQDDPNGAVISGRIPTSPFIRSSDGQQNKEVSEQTTTVDFSEVAISVEQMKNNPMRVSATFVETDANGVAKKIYTIAKPYKRGDTETGGRIYSSSIDTVNGVVKMGKFQLVNSQQLDFEAGAIFAIGQKVIVIGIYSDGTRAAKILENGSQNLQDIYNNKAPGRGIDIHVDPNSPDDLYFNFGFGGIEKYNLQTKLSTPVNLTQNDGKLNVTSVSEGVRFFGRPPSGGGYIEMNLSGTSTQSISEIKHAELGRADALTTYIEGGQNIVVHANNNSGRITILNSTTNSIIREYPFTSLISDRVSNFDFGGNYIFYMATSGNMLITGGAATKKGDNYGTGVISAWPLTTVPVSTSTDVKVTVFDIGKADAAFAPGWAADQNMKTVTLPGGDSYTFAYHSNTGLVIRKRNSDGSHEGQPWYVNNGLGDVPLPATETPTPTRPPTLTPPPTSTLSPTPNPNLTVTPQPTKPLTYTANVPVLLDSITGSQK